MIAAGEITKTGDTGKAGSSSTEAPLDVPFSEGAGTEDSYDAEVHAVPDPSLFTVARLFLRDILAGRNGHNIETLNFLPRRMFAESLLTNDEGLVRNGRPADYLRLIETSRRTGQGLLTNLARRWKGEAAVQFAASSVDHRLGNVSPNIFMDARQRAIMTHANMQSLVILYSRFLDLIIGRMNHRFRAEPHYERAMATLMVLMETLKDEPASVVAELRRHTDMPRIAGLVERLEAGFASRLKKTGGKLWPRHPLFMGEMIPGEEIVEYDVFLDNGFSPVKTHDGSRLFTKTTTNGSTNEPEITLTGDLTTLAEIITRLAAANGGPADPQNLQMMHGMLPRGRFMHFYPAEVTNFLRSASLNDDAEACTIFFEDGMSVTVGFDPTTLAYTALFRRSTIPLRKATQVPSVPTLDAKDAPALVKWVLDQYERDGEFKHTVFHASVFDFRMLPQNLIDAATDVKEAGSFPITNLLRTDKSEIPALEWIREAKAGIVIDRDGNFHEVRIHIFRDESRGTAAEELTGPRPMTVLSGRPFSNGLEWTAESFDEVSNKERVEVLRAIRAMFAGRQVITDWKERPSSEQPLPLGDLPGPYPGLYLNPEDMPKKHVLEMNRAPDPTRILPIGVEISSPARDLPIDPLHIGRILSSGRLTEVEMDMIFPNPKLAAKKSFAWARQLEGRYQSPVISRHFYLLGMNLAAMNGRTAADIDREALRGNIAQLVHLASFDTMDDLERLDAVRLSLVDEVGTHPRNRMRPLLGLAQLAMAAETGRMGHDQLHSILAEIVLMSPENVFEKHRDGALPGPRLFWRHEREGLAADLKNAKTILALLHRPHPRLNDVRKKHFHGMTDSEFLHFMMAAGLHPDRHGLNITEENVRYAVARHDILKEASIRDERWRPFVDDMGLVIDPLRGPSGGETSGGEDPVAVSFDPTNTAAAGGVLAFVPAFPVLGCHSRVG